MDGEGSTASNSIGECSHCMDVSVDPVTMHCGHTICSACLRRWLTSRTGPGINQPCPVCRVLERYKSLYRIYRETRKCGDGPIPEDSESHYEGRPIRPARDSHEEHLPVSPPCSSGRLLASRSERVPVLAPRPDRNQGAGTSQARMRVGPDNVAPRELTPTVLATAQLRDRNHSRLRDRGNRSSRSPAPCVQVPNSRPLRQRTRTYRAAASHASRRGDNLQRTDLRIRRVGTAENALARDQPVDIREQPSGHNHSARDLTSVLELLRRSIALVSRLQAEIDVKVAELLSTSVAALENNDSASASASGP